MATPTPRFEYVNEGGWGRPPPSLGRALAHTALWIAVVVGVGAAVRPLLPLSPESASTRKFEHFAANKDDYDVLFIGSSQVYRHVDPARFDRLMAEAGHPVRSFNFGVAGMAALENRALITRIAALQPARLKWVFTDVQRTGVRITGDNHFTARLASWHDPLTTWRALAVVAEADMSWSWKLDMAARHLVAFGSWLSNSGRARDVLEPHVGGTEATREAALPDRFDAGAGGLGPRGDGWVPLELAFAHATPFDRALIRERVQIWKGSGPEQMKRLRADPHQPRPVLEYSGELREPQELLRAEQALLTDFIDQVRAAGAEPVFINAPDVRQYEYMLEAALEAGVIPGLIDLDDPVRFPGLLRADVRYDLNHLNQAGAGLYTRALASEFAARLDGDGAEGAPRR